MNALTEAKIAAPLQMGKDLPKFGTKTSQADAKRVAEDFEAVFLGQFTAIVFAGIKSDGPFGGGPSEDIFKSLLAEEYGKALAKSGNFGIADSVYREIIKSQEVQ
jgi:Rod binding domain-containing protein